MQNGKFSVILVCSMTIALFLEGCISWKKGWEEEFTPGKEGNAYVFLKEANTKIQEADTGEKLMASIDCYEKVITVDPRNYEALYKLGCYHILMGASYSDTKKDKKFHYKEALKLCEKAMYLNMEFKKRIDSGETIWTACNALTEHEIDAMGYWTVALLYYYKECLSGPALIFNYKWIKRVHIVMERIHEINPEWSGGANYFNWAICYVALPESVGGDMKKAEELFEKAEEVGPKWLITRWGRAKYFHVKAKNREGFKKDLHWVLEQDLREADGPYPWNVYFQREAKTLLEQENLIFD